MQRVAGEPRISELRFTNYRALQSVVVPLRSRLVALIGKNGSGKTSVLRGAQLLSQMFHFESADVTSEIGPAARVMGGREGIARVLTRGTVHRAHLQATSADGQYRVDLSPSEPGPIVQWKAPRESMALPGTVQNVGLLAANFFANHAKLGLATFLEIASRNAAAPSRALEEVPQVGSDGSGLASAFAYIAANHPELREAIEADLAAVVPGAKRVRTPKKKVPVTEIELMEDEEGITHKRRVRQHVMADTIEVEMHSAGFLGADELSEGTVLTLALLTLLHAPECPQLVLLDDLDRALHPSAIHTLLERLRELLERKPTVQIVATTHSPYLIDDLAPEQVVAMALDAKGHAHARSLAEHPDLNRFKDTLRTGEFWSSVGEEWVIPTKADAA